MAKLKANQFEYKPGLVTTERPILFQTDMVQAILAGRKTQTRRMVQGEALEWLEPDMFTPEFVASPENYLCKYGNPGDLLWVRETWAPLGEKPNQNWMYKSDVSQCYSKWKPSIHMPKDACRIWLMIEDLRVERLQDISEEDAIAEGIEYAHKDDFRFFKDYTGRKYHLVRGGESFETLWISINGKESWDSNPWVWVIKFRVLSKTGRPSREEIVSAYYDVTSECNANEETATARTSPRSDEKKVNNG